MKKIILLCISLFATFASESQQIIGAWETFSTDKNGDQVKHVAIFTEGYKSVATYHASTGKFISTNGGSWKLDGDTYTEMIEFDNANPERVGTEWSIKVLVSDDTIKIPEWNLTLNRIDIGQPGELQGAWLMSGRVREGETQLRDTDRPRKTMKILSGTRFQWIAYNTETKKFMGTGGGTYTTKNGEYTEHIEFFSKDDSKTGLKLTFNYELIDGNWHHKGLSSKGDPIHEIWTRRE